MAHPEFTSTEELEAELARTSPLQRYPGGAFDETTRAAKIIRELARRDASRTAERIEALEAALTGMCDAYVALLLMKAEDPSRFQEPGSPYAIAKALLHPSPAA